MTVPANPFCGGTTRAHTDCHRPAGWGTDHVGIGRCKLHGGATETHRKHAKTVRAEAWERILAMTDPALTRLLYLVDNAETDTVRLGAVRDVLDRAGLGAKHVHEVTGPGGGPIPVEVRTAELLARAQAMRPPGKKGKTRSAKRVTRKAVADGSTERLTPDA